MQESQKQIPLRALNERSNRSIGYYLGVFESRGYLVGVLIIRGSYNLGMHIVVNPLKGGFYFWILPRLRDTEAFWTKFDINALTKSAEEFDKLVRRMPKDVFPPTAGSLGATQSPKP